MKLRRAAARDALDPLGADALVAWKPENRRYLSGFSGSSGALLLTRTDAILFTDSRYADQARAEAFECDVVVHSGPLDEAVAGTIARLELKAVAIEEDAVSLRQLKALARGGARLVDARGTVEFLRMRKSEAEIRLIEQSLRAAEVGLENALRRLRPGMTEADATLELEYQIRRAGAERVKPNLVVASGPRSALPHGRPTTRVLGPGDLLTLDVGGAMEGYWSDLTRTVCFGPPSPRQREMYDLVAQVQRDAIAAIREGVRAAALDQAAREAFAAAGYGDHVRHGLGHGVGLAPREEPDLEAASEATLSAGMVIAVEPGVYVPGFGGVRIEDMVVVGHQGCRNITTFPRELRVIE